MSIWDEKPRLWPAGMGGYGPKDNYYEQTPMDAWLEKVKNWIAALKTSVDILIAENNRLKEKAEKYDTHEWITKETEEGEVQDLYHIDELATAVEDKRKAEGKLEAVRKWLQAQLGNEVDPQDLTELHEILEAEG